MDDLGKGIGTLGVWGSFSYVMVNMKGIDAFMVFVMAICCAVATAYIWGKE